MADSDDLRETHFQFVKTSTNFWDDVALLNAISASDSRMTISSNLAGDLSAGILISLIDENNQRESEIVEVETVNVSTGVVGILRARENTLARDWPAQTKMLDGFTAGQHSQIVGGTPGASFSALNHVMNFVLQKGSIDIWNADPDNVHKQAKIPLSIIQNGTDLITTSALATTLEAYTTTAALNGMFANYITNTQLAGELAAYATQSDLNTGLASRPTTAEMNTAINNANLPNDWSQAYPTSGTHSVTLLDDFVGLGWVIHPSTDTTKEFELVFVAAGVKQRVLLNGADVVAAYEHSERTATEATLPDGEVVPSFQICVNRVTGETRTAIISLQAVVDDTKLVTAALIGYSSALAITDLKVLSRNRRGVS